MKNETNNNKIMNTIGITCLIIAINLIVSILTYFTIIKSMSSSIQSDNVIYDKSYTHRNCISIIKTNDGFDVYKGNILKHEFNKQNTDSLSLETLGMIYEE